MPTKLTNIRNCLGYIKEELMDLYPPEEAQNIAYLLMEETLSFSRTELLSNLHGFIKASFLHKIIGDVVELKKGKPIQYVVGKCEFYDSTILLNHGILIPRPETEELIQWILQDTVLGNISIMDVGTGSGCIAISLAHHLVSASIVATDNSTIALETAEKSALLNHVSVTFYNHDILLNNSSGDLPIVNIIVSNPPYVLESEKKQMRRNVLNYEPHESLFVPDNDPLLFYKAILSLARTNLNPKEGLVYFEINEQMGNQMKDLLEEFSFTDIELRRDLHGKERMIKAKVAEANT